MKVSSTVARPRHPAVAVLAAWTITLLVVLVPVPAGAHPYLVQTLPGPGAILRNPPSTIEIGFTESLVLEGSSLRLEGPEGEAVRLGALRPPKSGPGLAADVEGTLEGVVYRVRWTVLGDDGHTNSGEFRFGVQGPDGSPPEGADDLVATGGPADQAPETEPVGLVVLRWAGLLGAAVLLGGAVLAARLRSRLDPDAEAAVLARWKRLSRLGWALALVGAASWAWAAAAVGEGPTRVSVALASETGRLAVLRLGVVAAAAIPALMLRRGSTRDNLLGLAGAVFLGVEAAGGHITALESGRLLAGLAQAAHLAAGGLWVGGILTLAFTMRGVPSTLRPAAWRSSLATFSPLAAASAAVVVVTGTIAAVRLVEYRYFLVFSTYGRVLLVKLALVAAMLALGGLAGRALLQRRRTSAPRASHGPRLDRMLRAEAALGTGVLVLAATLAGVAQSRGQPLPAQRESVLAGPAFANLVVGGGLVRLLLAPATPGPNRITVLPAAVEERPSPFDVIEQQKEQEEAGEEKPRSVLSSDVEVSLSCACSKTPITVTLQEGRGGAWQGDVDLPAEGVWRASVTAGGQGALAPVALRVAEEGAPGAPPVVIAAPADLSGPGARRCRSFQLGMLLALAFLNAGGGVNGRKVVLDARDDGGDAARARRAAEELRSDADLAAPCGQAAAAAARVLARNVPVVVADAQSPPTSGERIFRLAGDPYAEGWAVGRTTLRRAFVAGSDLPRRMAVVVDEDDPSATRAVAGVRAALALPPSDAVAAVEGERLPSGSDIEVEVMRHARGESLQPLLRAAVDPTRFAAAFLRSDPTELAAALDTLTDEQLLRPNAVFTGSLQFDEDFLRGSRLGRRGDITLLGEVAPDSGESLLYTRLVFSLYPGEQPTIDGLRGYMAGKAITEGLAGGSSAGEIARRLTPLGPFSDGVTSGWSPGAPAAGSWRFLVYRATIVAAGLVPTENPPSGRFFPEGGAWSRVISRNVGLCGPQEEVGGPAPECKREQQEKESG